jgi:hypothetical protein
MANKRRKATSNMPLGARANKVDEGALALYLDDIKNHPLLTRAEEAGSPAAFATGISWRSRNSSARICGSSSRSPKNTRISAWAIRI